MAECYLTFHCGYPPVGVTRRGIVCGRDSGDGSFLIHLVDASDIRLRRRIAIAFTI
jgi:hypothetical protein